MRSGPVSCGCSIIKHVSEHEHHQARMCVALIAHSVRINYIVTAFGQHTDFLFTDYVSKALSQQVPTVHPCAGERTSSCLRLVPMHDRCHKVLSQHSAHRKSRQKSVTSVATGISVHPPRCHSALQ